MISSVVSKSVYLHEYMQGDIGGQHLGTAPWGNFLGTPDHRSILTALGQGHDSCCLGLEQSRVFV